MNEREKTIRLWFDMWLNQQDMGIDDIFTVAAEPRCRKIDGVVCRRAPRNLSQNE